MARLSDVDSVHSCGVGEVGGVTGTPHSVLFDSHRMRITFPVCKGY